jgi:hypothetical protein
VRLACQLIAGKLVRKNHLTQVTGFIVDLAGKCVEGMQMNWVSYLINELEKDCREAQDQGYEFHFSWLLVLIAFVAWKMLEGVTFLEVEPSEPLAARFSTLWYTNDMSKQWQSNVVFHAYYQQLKHAIEAFPMHDPNTLHQYRPLAKFCADRHFIYITARRDESKEELQSYYKLTDEDMEEITKEWPKKFLVPVEDAELSDADIIGSPLVTRVEHVGQSSAKKKKKKIEVQSIEIDEEDNASEEDGTDSPGGGGGEDQGNGQGGGDDTEMQEEGGATPASGSPYWNRGFAEKEGFSRETFGKKEDPCANKPQSKNVLTEDDVGLIIAVMEDASEDILQRHGVKQETLYERIEKELKEIQQAIHSSRAVSTVPSSSKIAELGDEPTQL